MRTPVFFLGVRGERETTAENFKRPSKGSFRKTAYRRFRPRLSCTRLCGNLYGKSNGRAEFRLKALFST